MVTHEKKSIGYGQNSRFSKSRTGIIENRHNIRVTRLNSSGKLCTIHKQCIHKNSIPNDNKVSLEKCVIKVESAVHDRGCE